jgi:NADPH-dependent 2,4-dienoyl-CoA reductase/sulfur reductase-like enzyme
MTTASNGRPRAGGIVIAGGGLAGQRCAEALRRAGYDGAITIACAELHRPYDRPPLSKELLTGSERDDALHYRPEGWYEEHRVELLLGVAATALHPGERRLELSDGRTLCYSQLLIATGGRPRTLPLLEPYGNVSTLRTVDDARALRSALASGARVVVIGAGFIGLEVAATARALGVEVTIVEAAPCALGNVLGPQLGVWFERLHREEGVRVLTGRTVARANANGSVRTLELSDGGVVACDHILVGVGIDPDVAWLGGSGLDVSRGVPVDVHGASGVPGVFAAGDAAATFDAASGRHRPGSHWEAAGRQAARAARAMLGLDPGEAPLTSFWTDQYGLRIQYVGDSRVADRVEIDGDPDARSFTATFTQAGRAVAALLVNRPRSLPAARSSIEKGRR